MNTNSTETGGSRLTIVKSLLCLILILFGAMGAYLLASTAPNIQKQQPVKMIPRVRTQTVFPENHTIIVHAMGTVIPSREITLKSRVPGEIKSVHPEFMKGGVLRKGDRILQIDDIDYKLALAQRKSAVDDARYALKLELGHQDVAKWEWKMQNGDKFIPDARADLTLRKPHLEKARSNLAAAKAGFEQARLQLARTKIFAPFNATVRTTHVEAGSQITPQDKLATLVGTDEYWVQVSIPFDRIAWITIPHNHVEKGAEAWIEYHFGAVCKGRVIRLLRDMKTEGRMAQLLIAVKDPLGLETDSDSRPAMLIGEYVKVNIKGHTIESIYHIPRTALRDNTHVWIAGKDGKLQIRKAMIVWRDPDTVLLKQGLQAGDRLIVSALAQPVPGMAVRAENAARPSHSTMTTHTR